MGVQRSLSTAATRQAPGTAAQWPPPTTATRAGGPATATGDGPAAATTDAPQRAAAKLTGPHLTCYIQSYRSNEANTVRIRSRMLSAYSDKCHRHRRRRSGRRGEALQSYSAFSTGCMSSWKSLETEDETLLPSSILSTTFCMKIPRARICFEKLRLKTECASMSARSTSYLSAPSSWMVYLSARTFQSPTRATPSLGGGGAPCGHSRPSTEKPGEVVQIVG